MKILAKIISLTLLISSSSIVAQETLQQVTDNGNSTSTMLNLTNYNGLRVLNSNMPSGSFNSIHMGQHGSNTQFMRFIPKSTGTGDFDWAHDFYYDFTNTKWGVDGGFDIEGTLNLTGRFNILNSTETLAGYFLSDDENSKFIFTYFNSGGAELEFQHDGDVILAQAGNVGIGNKYPKEALDVVGSAKVKGRNLDGKDLSYLNNSNSLLIGWNRSGGHGETSFLTNRGAGSRGGFDFRDVDNSGNEKVLVKFNGNGNVGIGTINPDEKLTVKGTIHSEEVRVDLNVPAPDYVFESDYQLRTLKETKEYITKNKHLPEIPSAVEIGKNGIDLGDMNMRLLKKIEELTLYQIQLMEEMEQMKKEMKSLKD